MNVFVFDNAIRQQIQNVVEYASMNIYQVDDILDMMNGQKTVPGAIPQHLITIPVGRSLCYYLVDHPELGRCHYFQIKTDVSGLHVDKTEIEYILKEFGIENALLDKHITVDMENNETKIKIPFAS